MDSFSVKKKDERIYFSDYSLTEDGILGVELCSRGNSSLWLTADEDSRGRLILPYLPGATIGE